MPIDLISRIQRRLSKIARISYTNTVFSFRYLTSNWRKQSDFIIIGGQKCGTTSLYKNIIKHPQIMKSFTKEVHYFDNFFFKGNAWYKANFPLSFWYGLRKKVFKKGSISGEASPYYIYHPATAERVAREHPKVKLIAILRNPVNRAYSEYQHQRRINKEPEDTFEAAIGLEEERLKGERTKLINNVRYRSFEHQRHSYLSRGKYAEQLKVWMEYFAPEQMLILKSEDFFKTPDKVYQEICDYLGVEKWAPVQSKRFHKGSYSGMREDTRERLTKYFSDYNKELYQLIEHKFKW